MTPEQHIARIREWGEWTPSVDVASDALALADAYEALAAEYRTLHKAASRYCLAIVAEPENGDEELDAAIMLNHWLREGGRLLGGAVR